MAVNLADALRLLLVTDDAFFASDRDPLPALREAVAGGVTAVQLRFKRMTDPDLLELARRSVAELPVPVFINDRLDIARLAGAAGVHLGSDDLPPAMARRMVPTGFVIGASVGVPGEIARGETADYWGIGPLRATGTKGDAGEALGLEGAGALLDAAGTRPCVLIGGVLPEDVRPARDRGFAGVAVASGILGAPDRCAAAKGYAGTS